jgi:hypothetical protein
MLVFHPQYYIHMQSCNRTVVITDLPVIITYITSPRCDLMVSVILLQTYADVPSVFHTVPIINSDHIPKQH